jgi:hypothetical protein
MKDSINRLSRTTLLATAAATALLLQTVQACGDRDTAQSSSSTNWLPCKSDEDCDRFEGASCGADRVCADERGEPIPATAEPTAGGQSSTGGRAATGGRADSGGATSSGGSSQSSQGGSPGGDGGTAGAGDEGGSGGAGGAGPEGGSSGAPSTTGGASSGGSSTGGAGAGGASCDGWPAPMLDRSCQTNDDCFVGGYMFNCCGSIRMSSFNVSQTQALSEHRRACDREPICDCLSWLELEDGTRLPNDPTLVSECIENRCEARCFDSGC